MKRKNARPVHGLTNVLILTYLMVAGSVYGEARQDDLNLVDRMLEVQPKLDLSKEAELQVKLIERRYGVDVAAVINGKIKYSLGQRGAARQSFKRINPGNKEFNFMVMSYFRSASSPTVRDTTGIKDSADLFLENKVYNSVTDRTSPEWSDIVEVLDTYGAVYSDDPVRMEKLKKVRRELGLPPVGSPLGRIVAIVNEAEAIFMSDKEGTIDIQKLQKILEELEDREFGEQNYEFYLGLSERARILTILSREDEAIKFLRKKEKHIDAFDAVLAAEIKKNKDIPRDQKDLVLKVSSIKSGFHYAMGLALFSSYLKNAENEPEKAKEAFFSKTGAVYHYYRCTSSYMGSKSSFKSILRYDQCREELSEKFQKNLKPLAVSSLQIGKSFYTLGYYEKAIEAFKKCFDGKEKDAFEAMRFAIPSYVSLEKYDDAEKVLKQMNEKFVHLNKAPTDYINKSGDYLSRKYRFLMYASEDETEKKQYEQKAKEIFLTYCAGDKNPGQASTLLRMASSAGVAARNALQHKKPDAEQLYQSANELYKKVISLYPSSNEAVTAYLRRGSLHLNFSKLMSAQEDFQAFLKAAPEISDDDVSSKRAAEINLLRVMIRQKDFEGAEGFLQSVRKNIKESSSRSGLKEKISGWNEIVDLSEVDILDSKSTKLSKLIKQKAALDVNVDSAQKTLKGLYSKLEDALKNWNEKFRESPNHPSMLARLGGLYMVQGRDAEAVSVYEKLAKLHPQSEVLKLIGINMASAFFEKGEYLEGAKALEKYTDISSLDNKNLYYLVKKFAAADLKEHEQKAVSSIVLKCFKKLDANGFAKNEINKRHELELIAARFMKVSGKTSESLNLLKKIADEKPNGPWIIDVLLIKGACHAEEDDFTAVSANFGILRKKVAAMKGGGDLSLKLKVEVEWSAALSNSKKPAHLKKGKALSFLAAQMNPLAIDVKERFYLEKAHYLNVLYAKLTGQGDLKTMKTEFLKKYSATRFAAKVRKL